jgi:hypothetical protein
MLRRKLEPRLDFLLGQKLCEPDFLRRVLDDYYEHNTVRSAPAATNESAVTAKIELLTAKRQRVLETYFEGVITKVERDRRIAEIDSEIRVFQGLLMESLPAASTASLDEIQKVLEPFTQWEFLERDDKRALLQAICPEITVFRYVVKSLTIDLGLKSVGCYEVSRSKTAP